MISQQDSCCQLYMNQNSLLLICFHHHLLNFIINIFLILSITQIINKRFYMGDFCEHYCFDLELDEFFENQKWQLLFLTTQPALNLSQSVRATISADSEYVRINIGLDYFLWKKTASPCTQKILKKAYYCTDCSRLNTPIFYCQDCFIQSTHSKKCKDTGFILLPPQLDKKLRCHCGERELTNIKHSCPQHRAVSLGQQQLYDVKQKLKSYISDCLCLYLEMLAYPVFDSASVDEKKKFCLQYISQLFSDLRYFGEEEEFVLQALTESFSNRIKYTIEQNKVSKFPILYILFKQQLNTEIFMEVLTIALQLKDQHWLLNTVERLVTNLIQNYSEQIQNQKKCVEKNEIQYIEKIIKFFIDKSHSYTIFAQLLTENIVPNSKHAFNKTKRYAVMRYISYLCYCIAEANISLVLWKDCLRALDKNKYIFLDIIYGQYFSHFMICATAHQVIFNNLISEMENQVRTKKQLGNLWLKINDICKALLYVSERKSQILKKYINKGNASNLLKRIVETEASHKIKGTQFQNQRNWCYQVRKILESNEQLIILERTQEIQQIQQIQQTRQNEQERLILEREEFEEQLGNPKIEKKEETKMKQSEKVEDKKLSAMQKKKKLLKEKYSKAHEKILPDTLQRLKSTQITCHICRQPNQPHKQQLFCLANLNPQITKSYLLNICRLSKYGVSECKHVFHVECIMKAMKMNGSLLQKCPLCKQNSNFGTLLQDEIMTQIGYVEFHQLLQNSKQLSKMRIPSILECLIQTTIALKLQTLLLPTNHPHQHPKTLTHTLQQLYLKQNKESKQKIENNINGLKWVSIEDESKEQCNNKADELYLQFQCQLSQRQKKQCCGLIGDVFNTAVLADITGMGDDQGVIARICRIFEELVAKYLGVQEVGKIVNLLPCQIQDKISITLSPTTIVVNQNPNKCTIIQQSCSNPCLIKDCIFNINLPICPSQFYNNLSEVCNHYRKHLKSYAMCLMCNKVICYDCKQHFPHSNSTKMDQHIFYLVLDSGEFKIVGSGKQQISKMVYNSPMIQNQDSQQNKSSKLTIINKNVIADTIFEFILQSRIKKNK